MFEKIFSKFEKTQLDKRVEKIFWKFWVNFTISLKKF